jgi:hypothetical protein
MDRLMLVNITLVNALTLLQRRLVCNINKLLVITNVILDSQFDSYHS